MKVLLLRGTDKGFDRGELPVDQCDDLYFQIATALADGDNSETWYRSGINLDRPAGNGATRRWFKNAAKAKCRFKPDVVIARGRFPEWGTILKRYRNAIKIWYPGNINPFPSTPKLFDLALVDTEKQKKAMGRRHPRIKTVMWLKPATENLFKPVLTPQEKIYDLIMVANKKKGSQKGHEFVFSSMPKGFKAIHIGKTVPEMQKRFRKTVHSAGFVKKPEQPKLYAQSKFAVIASSNGSADCVISEALACNCPLLVCEWCKLWKEKYITPETGMITNRKNFKRSLLAMQERYSTFHPKKYYDENLSLKCCAQRLTRVIKRL